MSYDFMMFKVRKPIASHSELSEFTTQAIGTGFEIKQALSNIFPETEWNLTGDTWWGQYEGADTWYEFQFEDEVCISISIHTSHRAQTRDAIKKICEAMGLVAFDGQKLELIGQTGEKT
jgi:hypothetical protein